ncbi:MAG: hypothetical protein ACR2M1_08290 [Gemmatimonadaceae bacterium]
MSPSNRGGPGGQHQRPAASASTPESTPALDGASPNAPDLVAETKPYIPAEHVDERRERATGFQLRRLLLLGANVAPAELRFTTGLNVISGPSNTGKSFALYCIDFLLGAKRLAKRVAEAQAYDEAVLEIESAMGEIFTLRRALTGGRFRWYDVPFEDIGQGTRVASLAAKHTAEQTDSASAQFLALSGLANRVLLKSRVNRTTQPLSFRNIAKLMIIEEQEIISPNSPVTGPNPIAHTAETSLFELLLTGRDAGDVVTPVSRADSRRRLQAQADIIDELLDALRLVETEEQPDGQELENRRATIDRQIEALTAKVDASSRSADDALGDSETEQTGVLEAKSRLLTVEELITRFRILRQSYETDLARLTLIQTGSDLLAQLPAVTCPTCGQPMGESHTEHDTSANEVVLGVPVTSATMLGPQVREACAIEATKIRAHLIDLELATQQLSNERITLDERVRVGSARLRELDRRLREELRPQVAATTRELQESSRVRQEVLRLEAVHHHRATLLERRYDIERDLRHLREAGTAGVNTEEAVVAGGLAATVRRLLRAWQLPHLTSVAFDSDAMDLVISGRPRRDEGKGVRAILYSAFVIGLMRLCRDEGRPHPGFVVLDSPLTTYRGPMASAVRGPEDVPPDVEAAFFRALADATGDGAWEQIIVLDNKEPPLEIRERINYIQFTGREDVGRAGFIPTSSGAGSMGSVD